MELCFLLSQPLGQLGMWICDTMPTVHETGRKQTKYIYNTVILVWDLVLALLNMASGIFVHIHVSLQCLLVKLYVGLSAILVYLNFSFIFTEYSKTIVIFYILCLVTFQEYLFADLQLAN